MTLTNSRTRGTVNTLSKVLPAQLLSMRNQEEIMNLVLSHSRYDEDSDVTYNWAGIEQDIKLKYVGNKPFIDCNSTDLPTYMYSDDFTLLNQMTQLNKHQVRCAEKLLKNKCFIKRCTRLTGKCVFIMNQIHVIAVLNMWQFRLHEWWSLLVCFVESFCSPLGSGFSSMGDQKN